MIDTAISWTQLIKLTCVVKSPVMLQGQGKLCKLHCRCAATVHSSSGAVAPVMSLLLQVNSHRHVSGTPAPSRAAHLIGRELLQLFLDELQA